LLNKYLVVARDVGGFDPVQDEKIIGEVVETVKSVAESVGDLQSFCSELKSQLITRFGKNVDAQVAGVGKTIFANIFLDGINICDVIKKRSKIVVRAQPVKSVHSLLDMAAYQVASLVKSRRDVEGLEIPDVLKKLVNKFTAKSSSDNEGKSSSDNNEGIVQDASYQEEDEEEEEFSTGPLRILSDAMKNNSQILINCCKKKRLLGRVKAFDRHCNMVLEGVKEMWTEDAPKTKIGDEKTKPVVVTKIRLISKMFLRGDPEYDIAATRPSLS